MSLLATLARPLIEAAVLAFGRIIFGYLMTWQAGRDAKALGRAEAERDAAMEAARVARDMEGVPMPDRDEVLKRLREGSV